MNPKEIIKQMIDKKEKELQEIKERSQKSEDVKELRSLNESIDNIIKELQDLKAAYAELDEPADEQPGEEGGARKQLDPLSTLEQRGGKPGTKEPEDRFDTTEYRKAFMEYVCRGKAIPQEYRLDQTTTTTDASAVIPTTIANRIIQELKSYGSLYAEVTKTNIQGGVNIPILTLKPTASWVDESTPSEDKKIEANTKISFSYYTLEVKLAQTLLANIVTLDIFQERFTSLAVEAIAQALDIAIMNGSGSGQPLGVTKDSRVPSANQITVASKDFTSWAGWKKNVFAKMKKSYRNGKFYMAQSTFDAYIDGMVDSNGQPIGRVNYGMDGAENYRFGGKTVETVEDDVVKPYDTASTGDVVAVFFNAKDYIINTNGQLTTVKWTDHDDNLIKNKVSLVCDGKLADANGIILIKKGA